MRKEKNEKLEKLTSIVETEFKVVDLVRSDRFSGRFAQILSDEVKEDRVVVRSDVERVCERNFGRRLVLIDESLAEFLRC